MTSLDQVLSTSQSAEFTYDFSIPEGWAQGRATFGGLPVGACIRSMQRHIEGSIRLRALSAQLLGSPRPGAAVIRLQRLRASSTVHTFSADVEQGGEVLTHVVGVFGKKRAYEREWATVEAPELPAWTSIEPLDTTSPFAPEFTRHFEYRTVGPLPYSGSRETSLGYLRPVSPCRLRDSAYLACLIDAWWLGTTTWFDEVRAAATLTLNAEFHTSAEACEPDLPLKYRGASRVMRDGYGMETRELWSLDGTPLVTATELVAVIK